MAIYNGIEPLKDWHLCVLRKSFNSKTSTSSKFSFVSMYLLPKNIFEKSGNIKTSLYKKDLI